LVVRAPIWKFNFVFFGELNLGPSFNDDGFDFGKAGEILEVDAGEGYLYSVERKLFEFKIPFI